MSFHAKEGSDEQKTINGHRERAWIAPALAVLFPISCAFPHHLGPLTPGNPKHSHAPLLPAHHHTMGGLAV